MWQSVRNAVLLFVIAAAILVCGAWIEARNPTHGPSQGHMLANP